MLQTFKNKSPLHFYDDKSHTLYAVVSVLLSLTPVALCLCYECVHVVFKRLVNILRTSGRPTTLALVVGLQN